MSRIQKTHYINLAVDKDFCSKNVPWLILCITLIILWF